MDLNLFNLLRLRLNQRTKHMIARMTVIHGETGYQPAYDSTKSDKSQIKERTKFN